MNSEDTVAVLKVLMGEALLGGKFHYVEEWGPDNNDPVRTLTNADLAAATKRAHRRGVSVKTLDKVSRLLYDTAMLRNWSETHLRYELLETFDSLPPDDEPPPKETA